MHRRRAAAVPATGGRARGQSLAEFALLVPLFLLILGGALDLGRLFYAHVAIENAAKEAALFGATNPRCDTEKTGCEDPNTVDWHLEQEAAGLADLSYTIECLGSGGASIGVNSCQKGDQYRVRVQSEFDFVTPLLSPLFSTDQLDLTSTAISPVIVAAFDPNATPIPIPTPTPTPSPTPTNPPGPTPTNPPGPTPTSAPTPSNQCTVPDFDGVKKNSATSRWTSAGFTGAITFQSGNGNYTIDFQSLTEGASKPCSSGITVGP